MSNIRGKFNSSESPSTTVAPGPGKTYGERARHRQLTHTAPSATPPTADAYRKAKDSEHLDQFDPNAAYRSGRGAVGAPYKPASLHYTEEGLASQGMTVAKSPKPVTDNMIHKFLERIIADPRLHSQRSIHKAVLETARTQAKKRV